MFALVDAEDYPKVIGKLWTKADKTHRYARTTDKYSYVYLHNFLLPDADEVDHIDGDGLNNRRDNLRACTSSENKQNKRKVIGFSSKFKGVCWSKKNHRWRANIKIEYRQTHLGLFVDEEAAARAYDAAARKHFGEFARLNFPEPGEQSALRKDE